MNALFKGNTKVYMGGNDRVAWVFTEMELVLMDSKTGENILTVSMVADVHTHNWKVVNV